MTTLDLWHVIDYVPLGPAKKKSKPQTKPSKTYTKPTNNTQKKTNQNPTTLILQFQIICQMHTTLTEFPTLHSQW